MLAEWNSLNCVDYVNASHSSLSNSIVLSHDVENDVADHGPHQDTHQLEDNSHHVEEGAFILRLDEESL